MIINEASIAALTKSVKTIFNNALPLAPNLYQQLAMTVPSNNSQEDYAWLGELPKMKEWIGDRELAKLRAHTHSIVNKTWANGIAVKREHIEDDQLGLYTPRIQQLAMMAAQHKDEIVFDLLKNGFTNTAYDGQFFFDTDHQDAAEGNQSNKGTAALAAASLDAAVQAMEELTDAGGEPLGSNPTHLVCGPSNRATARGILSAQVLASGATNTQFGMLDLIISPRLVGASAAYWYLLDLSKPVKSLILQDRRPVNFTAMDSLKDENTFTQNFFKYGADARYNAGYGLWQLAWGSDGTT